LYYAEKLKRPYAIAGIALLILFDLVGVDRRYVNTEDFVIARMMEKPFVESEATTRILQDKGYYRVYDDRQKGIAFNYAETNYFHNALGGYHAAKPGRIQDLYDFYIEKGNPVIFNMMNVKYILVMGKEGQVMVQTNLNANGPAWFVENVLPANSADQEIKLLDSLNSKTTAVVHSNFLDMIPSQNIARDSTASIDLTSHSPNHLVYETATQTDQLAIFSEVYYPNGWNAYIDGVPAAHFRANYTLRAMVVPKGVHQIEFKFEPQVVKTGSRVALASSIVLLLVMAGGLFFYLRKEKPPTTDS
jgi:hypothetical protein